MPTFASARYALERELARGGMGVVYEARDHLLSRTVAVKVAQRGDHEASRARFEREMELTARLAHPGIVRIHDAGITDEGLPFYVMRLVRGERLDERIHEADAPRRRLALIPDIIAICNAIAHAHERGVIHRDLKPHNVIVGTRWMEEIRKMLDEAREPSR